MSVLTEEIRQQILAYLPRYPSKQAVTLPALHLVQDALRCVPLQAIREIADILDLSPAEVHDAMTFYGFFRGEQAKLGRTRVWVCRSLSCMLRGGEELLGHICKKLDVTPGGTTADGKITVEFAECLGGCEAAPCMLIDDKLEGRLRPDLADRILAWLNQLRGVELASRKLLLAVGRKGRKIGLATEGSEELRLLQCMRANACVGGERYLDIILQEDARTIEVLEEYLHGTQARIGMLRKLRVLDAEIHVKHFMLRHRRLLGISEEDCSVLLAMLGE